MCFPWLHSTALAANGGFRLLRKAFFWVYQHTGLHFTKKQHYIFSTWYSVLVSVFVCVYMEVRMQSWVSFFRKYCLSFILLWVFPVVLVFVYYLFWLARTCLSRLNWIASKPQGNYIFAPRPFLHGYWGCMQAIYWLSCLSSQTLWAVSTADPRSGEKQGCKR